MAKTAWNDSASRRSLRDISPARRGSLRSRRGPYARTYNQLYDAATKKGIRGRSLMNKRELARAVGW